MKIEKQIFLDIFVLKTCGFRKKATRNSNCKKEIKADLESKIFFKYQKN